MAGAVYPLHSIARVYTFVLHPKRGEATWKFLRRLGIILVLALFVLIISATRSTFGSPSDSDGAETFATFLIVCAILYCVGDLCTVLFAQSHHVLAVETFGPSTAMVSSRDPQELRRLVDRIAHAIENPDTEFRVTVGTLNVNAGNYHFGDNVNIYGGSGNTGVNHG